AVSMESDGHKIPLKEVKKIQFIFKGAKLIMKGNSEDDSDLICTYTLGLGKTAKTMDFASLQGAAPVRSIYSLKGDQLKICFRKNGDQYPGSFVCEVGSKNILIILQRDKADKSNVRSKKYIAPANPRAKVEASADSYRGQLNSGARG